MELERKLTHLKNIRTVFNTLMKKTVIQTDLNLSTWNKTEINF